MSLTQGENRFPNAAYCFKDHLYISCNDGRLIDIDMKSENYKKITVTDLPKSIMMF